MIVLFFHLTCQDIIFISYGKEGIIVVVANFDLATSIHGVGSILLMVVVNTSIVYHSREIGMIVLKER